MRVSVGVDQNRAGLHLRFCGAAHFVYGDGSASRRCGGTTGAAFGQTDGNGPSQGKNGGAILSADAHIPPPRSTAVGGNTAVDEPRPCRPRLLVE